jgi:hypothetical protein
MNHDPIINIDICNAESASKGCQGTTYEKLVAAMKAVRWNTMAQYGRDHAMLNASVAGVVTDIGQDSEDGQRLCAECRNLNKLNAYLAAATSGLAVECPEAENVGGDGPIGIMQAWEESK